MLKLAKASQIQGIPGFLDVWILGLRNPEMLPKVHIIIPLSWIYTKCVKFSKLLAIIREIQVARNDEILKFCVENQVSWHKLSGINNLHVEISQN